MAPKIATATAIPTTVLSFELDLPFSLLLLLLLVPTGLLVSPLVSPEVGLFVSAEGGLLVSADGSNDRRSIR